MAVEVGGQAVIEGVLMRRAGAVAVVCRRPTGELVVREGTHRRIAPAWVIKIAIFLAYLAAIARLPDVKRLFAYHGAEHKSIACFEAKLPLTVENARAQTRFHARCGTSLVLLVVFSGILLSSLALTRPLSEVPFYDHLLKILVKVPLMLPIAGLAYEALKLGGRNAANPLLKPLVAPGLLLQRLTTREPDDAQLEVALVAARLALARGAEDRDPVRAKPLVSVFASPSEIDLPLVF